MNTRGITLVELIVVLVVMTAMLLMALPSLVHWQRNAAYRDTARNISNLMRDARARAINEGLNFRAEFDVGANRYELIRVNPNGTLSTVSQFTYATGLIMRVGANCDRTTDSSIEFQPNGCASLLAGERAICVMDSNGNRRFRVTLESDSTCRVRIDR